MGRTLGEDLKVTKSMLHLAAVAGLALALPAHADFSGYYAPAKWIESWSCSPPGCSDDEGSVLRAGAPLSITLVGSDTGSGKFSRRDFTIASQGAGMVSFDWTYKTTDSSGPFWDPAGYFDPEEKRLSNDSGSMSQSGSISFSVNAGDVIGFHIGTFDNTGGNATLTISNFSAPIPEPASIAMMGLGLAAVAGVAARRRRAR
jgi:hypothetical protein